MNGPRAKGAILPIERAFRLDLERERRARWGLIQLVQEATDDFSSDYVRSRQCVERDRPIAHECPQPHRGWLSAEACEETASSPLTNGPLSPDPHRVSAAALLVRAVPDYGTR